MIDDLDRTIEALLRHELPPELVSQVAITFAAPDADFPPTSVTLPAIDLFLYDIRENLDLRSGEWLVERNPDGRALRHPPSVRVDCSYLVSAWPSESSTSRAHDEHRLLGEVLTALLRHRRLPAELLRGALAAAEPPLIAATVQPSRLQSIAQFWQVLGGKPKPALNYTVTISVLAAAPEEAGPPVLEKVLRMRQRTGEETS